MQFFWRANNHKTSRMTDFNNCFAKISKNMDIHVDFDSVIIIRYFFCRFPENHVNRILADVMYIVVLYIHFRILHNSIICTSRILYTYYIYVEFDYLNCRLVCDMKQNEYIHLLYI